MKHRVIAVLVSFVIVAGAALVACSGGGNASARGSGLGCVNVDCQQYGLENVTGHYMNQTHTAGWASSLLNQHGPTAEMQNLAARITRLSDPNKIGYLYIRNELGQIIGFFVTRGKVSSTGSQLSNTVNRVGDPHADHGGVTVASPGDDGTFGPEECEGQGVFFFDASSDAMGEHCGGWDWFDSPLSIQVPVLKLAAPTTPVPAGGSTKK